MTFCIKEGYVERARPTYFIDDGGSGITFQPQVYTWAEQVVERGILDVGCGQAGKLVELHEQHPDWTFIGIDYGVNIDWCAANFPWGSWYNVDLEGGLPPGLDTEGMTIVCADVIEHLRDPRPLLASIRSTGCLAVFSTPERDLWYGEDHYGPPPNPSHVREWNSDEFVEFLTQQGFDLTYSGLTASDDVGTGNKTILVVAIPS
jgi:Putative methyltransferase